MPMQVAAGRASAEIPAGYADSAFHLQYYISVVDGGAVRLAPGFTAALAGRPYGLILQAA